MSDTLLSLTRATWPAAATRSVDGWSIRDGQGGGSRVSAATWDGTGSPDISRAEAEMTAQGQEPIFMIRPQDEALDADLAAQGYEMGDPTQGYVVSTPELAQTPPPVTSFAVWPPLAIQTEIWAEGGIGPERLAVMQRASGPKTALFGRMSEKPAGAAFVAMSGRSAMLHALEVSTTYRRRGLAQIMMRHAGQWALEAGASHLYLLVTKANEPANRLYTSLGFKPDGHYHYRRKPLSG